ncbi:hypothetical protein [Aeoliella sp.]|uniref:hypothetical protein n=1 Tax=Aeoliella sp. TaxID=2795800 RepID=UPI003CCBB559
MASISSLPTQLQYLQHFLSILVKLPPEDWDDVDPSPLMDAILERIEGLDELDAEHVLTGDRDLLEHWLVTTGDATNPAYWILGFMHSPPHLLDELLDSSDVGNKEVTISFELPTGWKATHSPSQLELTCGEVFAIITAVDKVDLESRRMEFAHWSAPPPLKMTLTSEDVAFESVRGTKHTILDRGVAAGKNIEYLLSVPGGYANVVLGHTKLADFDESAMEVLLHTLRIDMPSS